MLKITCLLKNTEAYNNVRDIIVAIAESDLANLGEQSNPIDIFRELRSSGIEVDLRSVAEIYINELSSRNDGGFMPADEVEAIGGIRTSQMINNVLNLPTPREQEISDMAPAQTIVSRVLNLFTAPYKSPAVKTTMKYLQDVVSTGMNRYLQTNEERGIPAKKDTRTFEEIANDAFDKLTIGITNLHGYVNGITELHQEVIREMEETINRIENSSDPNATMIAQNLRSYTQSFLDSTSQLMLTKGEAMRMVTGALQSVDEGKFVKTKADGTTQIDFNALAGHNKSVLDIEANVAKAFSQQGFSPAQIAVITAALQKEFLRVYTQSQDRQMKRSATYVKPTVNTTQWEKAREDVSSIMSKFGIKVKMSKGKVIDKIMEALAQVKTYDKAKLKEVKKEFAKIKLNIGSVSGIKTLLDEMASGDAVFIEKGLAKEIIKEALKEVGFDTANIPKMMEYNSTRAEFVKNLRDGLDKMGLSNNEIDVVMNSIRPDYENYHTELKRRADKLLKSKTIITQVAKKKTELQRLAELNSLGVFQSSHKNALWKVLGVGELEAGEMSKIQSILDQYEVIRKLLDGKNIPEFTVQSVAKEVQDKINKIVADALWNKNSIGKVSKAVEYTTSQIAVGILGNAMTMAKNVFSGAGRMLDTFWAMRKEGLSNKDAMSIWWDAFTDVAFQRGVQESLEKGTINSNRYLNDVYREHKIFSLNNAGNVKEIAKSLARSFFKLAVMSFHILGTAVDSANKAVFAQNEFIMGYNEMLKLQGKDKEQRVQAINDTLFDSVKFADAIRFAEELYSKVDIKPAPGAVRRLARQIMRANLISHGGVTEGMLSGLLNASYKQASIALGHEMQHGPLSYIIGGPGKVAENLQARGMALRKEYIGSEQYSKLAGLSLLNSGLGQFVFMFARGAAAWAVLKIQDQVGALRYTSFDPNAKTNEAKKMMDEILDGDTKEEKRRALTEKMLFTLRNDKNIRTRGQTGYALSAMFTAALIMIAKGMDDDDDDTYKESIDNLMQILAKKPRMNRLFKAIWPALLSNIYNLAEVQNAEGRMLYYKIVNYIGNQYNVGNPYSLEGFVQKFAEKVPNDTGEAEGIFGKYLGSKMNIGAALGWNNIKNVDFFSNIASEEKEKWVPNTSIKGGIFNAMYLDQIFSDVDLFQDYGISQIPGVANGTIEGLKKAKVFQSDESKFGRDISINDVRDLKEYAKSKSDLEKLKTPYTRTVKGREKTYYRQVFSGETEKTKKEGTQSEIDKVWDYLQNNVK